MTVQLDPSQLSIKVCFTPAVQLKPTATQLVALRQDTPFRPVMTSSGLGLGTMVHDLAGFDAKAVGEAIQTAATAMMMAVVPLTPPPILTEYAQHSN
jgi:hypothetical protein